MSALDSVHYGFGHHLKCLFPQIMYLYKSIGSDYNAWSNKT